MRCHASIIDEDGYGARANHGPLADKQTNVSFKLGSQTNIPNELGCFRTTATSDGK